MSYKLKIKANAFIDIDEWREILDSTSDFARISEKDFVEQKGPGGHAIRFPVNEGDAEVYFPAEKEWYVIFHYND